MINDTAIVYKKSKKVLGWIKIGEITPAENQATDTFPKTSEILPFCALDNLVLKGIL